MFTLLVKLKFSVNVKRCQRCFSSASSEAGSCRLVSCVHARPTIQLHGFESISLETSLLLECSPTQSLQSDNTKQIAKLSEMLISYSSKHKLENDILEHKLAGPFHVLKLSLPWEKKMRENYLTYAVD